MNSADIDAAREFASSHGLDPRGTRAGLDGYTLYAFDRRRGKLFYFSSVERLQEHVADNERRRHVPARPVVRGRRRAQA